MLKKTKSDYVIELYFEGGDRKIILCSDHETILDCAEEKGLDLPYGRRDGTDLGSLGKLLKGQVDQGNQTVLDDHQIEMGYFLMDISKPKSNLIIEYGDN